MLCKLSEKWKLYCIGYFILFLWNIASIGSSITAQLSMATTAVFELAFIWNIYSLIVAVFLLVILNKSLKILTKDIPQIVIFSVLDFVIVICVALAQVFNPVGNTAGVYICLFIIFTTVVDLFRKKIKASIIISAVLAALGVLMLIQPWYMHQWFIAQNVFETPCEIFNNITLAETSNSKLNSENLKCENTTSSTDSNGNNLTNCELVISTNLTLPDTAANGMNRLSMYQIIGSSKYSILYGYIFTVVGALGDTVNSNIGKNFMENYSAPSLIFWATIIHLALSFVLTFSLSHFPGYGGWTLPGSGYCFLFSFLFTIFTSLLDITEYYSYDFLPISQTAILRALSILILYICQRTFMLNSGNANAVEIIGALFAFCGIVLTPVMSIFGEKEKDEEETQLIESASEHIKDGGDINMNVFGETP